MGNEDGFLLSESCLNFYGAFGVPRLAILGRYHPPRHSSHSSHSSRSHLLRLYTTLYSIVPSRCVLLLPPYSLSTPSLLPFPSRNGNLKSQVRVLYNVYINTISSPNLGFEIVIPGREREQGRFEGSIEGVGKERHEGVGREHGGVRERVSRSTTGQCRGAAGGRLK